MRSFISRLRGAWLAAPLAALLLVGAMPATASAASAISIRTYIGDSSVRVTAPLNSALKLTWKNSAGVVKEKASFTNGDSSYVYYDAVHAIVAVGDRINITDGTQKHVLVVPQLSINVNRVRDTLKGTGPAGGIVRLLCSGGPLPAFEGCIWHDRVRVDSTGHWSHRLPWDVLGGSMYHAGWNSPGGDQVWVTGVSSFLDVTIGKSAFSGTFRAGHTANIVVRDGVTLDPLATGSAVGELFDGEFSGHFRDSGGNGFQIMPGDRITSDIAADLDFVVPDIQIAADAATDTVSGQCFATGETPIRIDVYRNGFHRGYAWDWTDLTSHFSTYMPHPGTIAYNAAVIKVGDKVSVGCMTPQGDWIRTWVTAS